MAGLGQEFRTRSKTCAEKERLKVQVVSYSQKSDANGEVDQANPASQPGGAKQTIKADRALPTMASRALAIYW
jgi:hypothetical protein